MQLNNYGKEGNVRKILTFNQGWIHSAGNTFQVVRDQALVVLSPKSEHQAEL